MGSPFAGFMSKLVMFEELSSKAVEVFDEAIASSLLDRVLYAANPAAPAAMPSPTWFNPPPRLGPLLLAFLILPAWLNRLCWFFCKRILCRSSAEGRLLVFIARTMQSVIKIIKNSVSDIIYLLLYAVGYRSPAAVVTFVWSYRPLMGLGWYSFKSVVQLEV